MKLIEKPKKTKTGQYATGEDILISGLEEAAVAQKILDYRKDSYRLLVSEHAGEVTGFIALLTFDIFHSPGRMGRITAFCVDETIRSTGVGTRLMEAAEAWFTTEGCTKLEVTSNERRTATHAYYKNRGWIEDSRRFVKYTKTG